MDRLDRDFTFFVMYDCQRQISSKDIDHIQPRSRLEKRDVTPEKINSIANFQLLDPGTNRGPKNDALFDEWFNGSSEDRVNVSDKRGFLDRHLIPSEPGKHKIESFDELLATRAERIARKLNERFQS